MLESKWFEQPYKNIHSFKSKRVAITEAEGWEKTIEKYVLGDFERRICSGSSSCCGLCDVAKANQNKEYPKEDILSIRTSICNFCPVIRILGHKTCIVSEQGVEQVFHLLMMREAWQVGGL